MFIRLTLGAARRADGGAETCPACRSTGPVTVLVDSEDWSTDQVQLMCPARHSWLSAGMEAWHLAHLVVLAQESHPDFVGLAACLADQQANEGG